MTKDQRTAPTDNMLSDWLNSHGVVYPLPETAKVFNLKKTEVAQIVRGYYSVALAYNEVDEGPWFHPAGASLLVIATLPPGLNFTQQKTLGQLTGHDPDAIILAFAEYALNNPYLQPGERFRMTLTKTPAQPKEHVTAKTVLAECTRILDQRAKMRDSEDTGERSMEKTVGIFNTWTGKDMSVVDGWRFMISLKMAREFRGAPDIDNYVDGANYWALLGEDRLKPEGA